MATLLVDDFTGTTTDPWNASNWTGRTQGGTGSGTIQTNRGRLTAATGAYTAQYALGAPASGDADDFDVTFSWDDQGAGEQYLDFIYRCTTNATSGAPGSAFMVEVHANSNKVGIYSLDSGGAISTGIEVTSAGVNDTNTHRMRIRVVGTQHRVKWWNDGTAEPSTWQIDETDPDGGGWTTGRVLLGKLNGADGTSKSTDIDDFILDDLTGSSTPEALAALPDRAPFSRPLLTARVTPENTRAGWPRTTSAAAAMLALVAPPSTGAASISATLASTSTSSATITATVEHFATLASASTSAGTITATVEHTATLASASTSSATITATVTGPEIAATLDSTSTSAATITAVVEHPATLASASTSTATITATVERAATLASASTSAATITATVEHPATLASASVSAGTITATVEHLAALDSTSASTNTITATVESAGSVSAALDSTSASSATITATVERAAALDSSSTSAATITATVEHFATLASASTSTATITATVEHFATLASTSTSSATITATVTGAAEPGIVCLAVTVADVTLTATAPTVALATTAPTVTLAVTCATLELVATCATVALTLSEDC